MNLKWKPWNEAFTSSLSLKIASFKNAFALLALLKLYECIVSRIIALIYGASFAVASGLEPALQLSPYEPYPLKAS